MRRPISAERIAALVIEGEVAENARLRQEIAELRRQLADREAESRILGQFLSVALAECHSLTGKVERSQIVIVHQRDELRRYTRAQIGHAA